MNLDWHQRLIDRMIKNNPDATIKDYFKIVDQADLEEDQRAYILEMQNRKNGTGVKLIHIEENQQVEVVQEKPKQYKTAFFKNGLKDTAAGRRSIYVDSIRNNKLQANRKKKRA